MKLRTVAVTSVLVGKAMRKESVFSITIVSGKARPSVKLIRRFCLECMGGSSQLVAGCQSLNCSIREYRFGRNPKRAGIGNKNALPPTVRLQTRFKNRTSDLNA